MATIYGPESFDSSPTQSTADVASVYSPNSGLSSSTFPLGWAKLGDTTQTTNGMIVGTAFPAALNIQLGPGRQASTWGSARNSTLNSHRGWVTGYSGTSSSQTGPSTGANGNRYLYVECTSLGAANYSDSGTRKRSLHLIKTTPINLSAYSSTEPIRLTGKFHAYGSRIGAFGVSATTNGTNASSDYEAFTGSGFTNYTNDSGDGLGGGGCDIDYANSSSATINTYNKKRIVGQHQASNGAAWKPFEVEMTGIGGNSSVYIYFLYEQLNYYAYQWNTTTQTGNVYWRGDFGIDDLHLETYSLPDTNYEGSVMGTAGNRIFTFLGGDLDQGDKVLGTDGDGVDAIPTEKVLTIKAEYDSAAAFDGSYIFMAKNSSNQWVMIDNQTISRNSFDIVSTIPSTHTMGSGINISIRFGSIPMGGNFTSTQVNVTNDSNANFTPGGSSPFVSGTWLYITGTWTNNGNSELEIEWEEV